MLFQRNSELASRRNRNTSSPSFEAVRYAEDPFLTPRDTRDGFLSPNVQQRMPVGARDSYGMYLDPANQEEEPLQRGIQHDTDSDELQNVEPEPSQSRPTTTGAHSSTSILETPINATQPPLRDSYRISPTTSQIFEDYSQKMESGHLDPSQSSWRRNVPQRRSYTDLRRSGALK